MESIVYIVWGCIMILWARYNYRNSDKMAKIHSAVSNVAGSGFNITPKKVKVSSYVCGMIGGIISIYGIVRLIIDFI